MRRVFAVLVLAAFVPACGGSSGGVVPPPLGFTSSIVRVGQEIVIQGPSFGNLQGASTVTVGGAAAAVVSWSMFEVRVVAPAAALSGVVELTVGGVPINPGSVTLLWPQFNPTNVAVSTAVSEQELPQAVSDGAGGSIVVWRDNRNGNFDLFAQRMSTAGAPMWTANGVAVCTQAAEQNYPEVASDGAGGVIIAWQDNRAGTLDIYAQRLNGAGAAQWTADGIGVCTIAGVQDTPGICADGAGGAILAWRDVRSGAQIHLYAQRLSPAGAALWTAGGVPVQVLGALSAEVPRIASDGAGGGIIVWTDLRNAEYDLYAQRLEGTAGAAQWTLNGITLCNAASTQSRAWTAPDGAGGLLVAWADFRNANSDLFAQRVNSAGAAQWAANGVAVCTALNSQDFCQLIPYGAGGLIVVWEDERNGVGNKDIFGQRLDGAGAAQWAAGGVAVCTAVANQAHAQVIPDGSGGAVIAWEDLRNGLYDVFAQRIDGSGVVQWAADGVGVCTVAGTPQQDARPVPDGTGGLVVAWRDARSGVDVYSQKVIGTGQQ